MPHLCLALCALVFALRVRCKFSHPLPPLKHKVWWGNKESVSAVFKMPEAKFEFLGEASMAMFGLFAIGFPLATKENLIDIGTAAEAAEVLPENVKMMFATIEKVKSLMTKLD